MAEIALGMAAAAGSSLSPYPSRARSVSQLDRFRGGGGSPLELLCEGGREGSG